MSQQIPDLGWHVLSGKQLLEMLHRVKNGEDPDMVYIEEYVNADKEDFKDADRD